MVNERERFYLSKDGYYIPGWEWEHGGYAVVRPLPNLHPVFATSEPPLVEHFYTRHFELQWLCFGRPSDREALVSAARKKATIRVDGQWYQHYSWGEMTDYDWVNEEIKAWEERRYRS